MYCRTHHRLCVLIASAIFLAVSGLVSAATLEVGTGSKTGYTTIQAAVDAARDGDTIVVSPGTYTGTGNRDIDLQGKTLTLESTDPANPSVVEATVIDCQGSVAQPHRGFYAVDFAGEISGLTIVNGVATAGGGVYCQGSALVLRHCHILDNATLPGDAKTSTDGGAGAGVYCVDSALEIVDCLISGNATGAGLDSQWAYGGDGGDGAGIYALSSALYLADSTVSYNTAGAGGSGAQGGRGGQGGGIYAVRLALDRCVIEGNTSGAGGGNADTVKGTGGDGGDGGGIYCVNAVDITDSLVVGNRSGQGGAGMTAGDDGQGAGIWCAFGTIDRCTIADNVALQQKASTSSSAKDANLGGGVFGSADTAVASSILWGNSPDQIVGFDCENVIYSDIEDSACADGKVNLAVDPLFAESGHWAAAGDAEVTVAAGTLDAVWVGGDYRLASTSPCLDAGDPDSTATVEDTDLDGQIRVSGEAVDMGAYEAQGLVPVYRFVSTATGKYFYTPSESEKDRVIAQFPDVWTYEGIAYYVYSQAIDADLRPVYRFWSDSLGSHFWTISESEKDKLLNQLSDTWTYEGLAFYAYPEGSQPDGAKPVYRFWSSKNAGHFYTMDEAEKEAFEDDRSSGWTYESIAWYALDEPSTDETPDVSEATSGVYEFSGQDGAISYVLELKAYLDGQEADLDQTTAEFALAAGRMQMTMDFDAMTAELTELHTESALLSYSGVVSGADGKIELPVNLYMSSFFDTSTARGPYAINPSTWSFPLAAYGSDADEDDACTIVGGASVEGEKFDVDLELNPTQFATGGAATFASLDESGRLDINTAGTFQWEQLAEEQLLLNAPIRGHVIQLYVTSVQVRTTGLWLGKRVEEKGDQKSEK